MKIETSGRIWMKIGIFWMGMDKDFFKKMMNIDEGRQILDEYG